MKAYGDTPRKGFTIVELLIVIVVIAILAAISMIAYTEIQTQARDSQRVKDAHTISTALEMFYVENGHYPDSMGDSTSINEGWSTTADESWSHLESQLVPEFISALPQDPINTPGVNMLNSDNDEGNAYAYFTSRAPNYYCGAAPGQMYILLYRLESRDQENNWNGNCDTLPIEGYETSSTRIVK